MSIQAYTAQGPADAGLHVRRDLSVSKQRWTPGNLPWRPHGLVPKNLHLQQTHTCHFVLTAIKWGKGIGVTLETLFDQIPCTETFGSFINIRWTVGEVHMLLQDMYFVFTSACFHVLQSFKDVTLNL